MAVMRPEVYMNVARTRIYAMGVFLPDGAEEKAPLTGSVPVLQLPVAAISADASEPANGVSGRAQLTFGPPWRG
jgi:hypothetical protein